MPTSDPLSHIPYLPGKPIVGHTLDIIRDFYGLTSRSTEAFGEMYRIKVMGTWRVAFTSADAVEYILTDPDHIFSSKQGWADYISHLFPGGLLLRDFDEHRQHRRIMQTAFRKPAMDSYLALMAPEMDKLVANWISGESFDFYAAIKELTLRMGAHVFMGLPADAPEAKMLNAAFIDELAAAVTVIRKPLPFTPYLRGLKARETLLSRFRALVEERQSGDGNDFFSRLCRAEDEDGQGWNEEEIVDHFNLLMMAAHDTTASVLTTMIWALTEYPEWQDRLAEEVAGLHVGSMTPEMLNAMPETDLVFREALRFVPPVAVVPRVAIKDFDWKGTHIPAGTPVGAVLIMVMHSSAYFTDPDRFDPERFSSNRAEDRNHRFAWAPFGGGAHKCIGLHFASMQVKAFLRALLPRYRLTRAEPGPIVWQHLPTSRPKGGLDVILSPTNSAI